ncbi:MAG: aldo/keto reductase [Phycisphaerae bacterium]|nr:aldo/keto reductase [Phycisphaerae bacterium]
MRRRELLRRAAGLAAWSGFWTAQARAEEKGGQPGSTEESGRPEPPGSAANLKETRKGDMLYRTLGKTGEQVSALGLGGYHLGTLKDESSAIRFIRTAIDRGITFMDNCWDYHEGKSEVWMGKALRDGYREKVFLMTKLDGRTREAAARQIDESLRRLQTDRIDLMQIHEIIRFEDPDRCFAEGGAIEAIEAAKKAGKIRYVGFTGHKDPIAHNRMLDMAARHKYHFDTCQMPINVLDATFRSFAPDNLPRMLREGIAILGMKSTASGAIIRNQIATPRECLSYALTLPTSVVISGMDSMEVLEQNLEIVRNFKPLGGEEMRALLARVAPHARMGKFERFKTTADFDGTARYPQWLG